MKRLIFGLSFVTAIGVSFAFSDAKQTVVEEDFIECERATLSCGKSGVACASTKEKVKEIIQNAEEALCD